MNDSRQIGIANELRRHDYRRRACRLQLLPILRICQKRDLPRICRSEGCDLRNHDRRISNEFTAQLGDDLVEATPSFLDHVVYLPFSAAAKALMIFSVISSRGLAQTTS